MGILYLFDFIAIFHLLILVVATTLSVMALCLSKTGVIIIACF